MRFRDRWLRQRYRALAESEQDLRYSGKPFGDFGMRVFLEAALAAPSIRAAMSARAGGRQALEYGTGTGPGACYLAERGFRVYAIDISADAIELARRIAGQKRLPIRFAVEDIVSLTRPAGSYALVLDNHCLHQVTGDEDRARALGNVRRVLADDGVYVLETVVYHEGRDYGLDRFDARTSTRLVRSTTPTRLSTAASSRICSGSTAPGTGRAADTGVPPSCGASSSAPVCASPISPDSAVSCSAFRARAHRRSRLSAARSRSATATTRARSPSG